MTTPKTLLIGGNGNDSPELNVQDTPLSAFPKLKASSALDTEAQIHRLFGGKIVALPEGETGLNAVGNNRTVSFTSSWFCSYGAPIHLDMAASDSFRLQYCIAGAGANILDRSRMPIGAGELCMLPRNVSITGEFGAGYKQLVLRFDARKLEAKLSALAGVPLKRALEFEKSPDLSTPRSRILREMTRLFIEGINSNPARPPSPAMYTLEEALAVKLLYSNRHNFSDLLDRDPADVAPWQVRRAEEYIAANWQHPISITELAEVTGVSARSLFRNFKNSRGYSPMMFQKRMRLERAEEMLRSGDTKMSVTDVAFACGFGDLANFSKDFRRVFGRKPSEVLRDGCDE